MRVSISIAYEKDTDWIQAKCLRKYFILIMALK